jgi:hypothetical protein
LLSMNPMLASTASTSPPEGSVVLDVALEAWLVKRHAQTKNQKPNTLLCVASWVLPVVQKDQCCVQHKINHNFRNLFSFPRVPSPCASGGVLIYHKYCIT